MKNRLFLAILSALVGFCWTQAQGQVIDDTTTRVQTTLTVPFEEVGTLHPKSVREIKTSQWTLGCETLDREYINYDRFKEYLPALGIGRIRLQAGWARTEKDPGIYDFGWLDFVINDAKSRGIDVWLETSYGNPAYPGGGGRTLADGMPTSEEGLKAWDNWVRTMAKRYKGKVRDWCVWNEPELRGANSNDVITQFNIRTAEIIKQEIPDARIAALALCSPSPKIIGPFLEQLKKENKLDLFDWIVYHHYTPNPDTPYKGVKAAGELVRQYSTKIKLWQGESGTQSEWCRSGAISRRPWTELTQAKWDTRRMLGDIGHGADSLVFTACDLDYRTTHFHNGLVRYGLIKTASAAEGYKVLKVKMAYYAVQNVVSVFNDDVELVPDFVCDVKCEKELAIFGHRDKKTGTPLIVFWDKTGVPADTNATVPATLKMKNPKFKTPVWVDTITGTVYAIPADKIKIEGDQATFLDIPAYDAPVFITDRSILTLDYSDYVLFKQEEAQKKTEVK